MDATSLVLMQRVNGVLEKELGSYEIERGLEYVFKAYVEEDMVMLYLTTPKDLSDEEYTNVFEEYDVEDYSTFVSEVEEIDDEYNPVWLLKICYQDDHEAMSDVLKEVIGIHVDKIKDIFYKLSIN